MLDTRIKKTTVKDYTILISAKDAYYACVQARSTLRNIYTGCENKVLSVGEATQEMPGVNLYRVKYSVIEHELE